MFYQVLPLTDDVVDAINLFTDTIHVETIQDIVEQVVSKSDFHVGKAYITYRYKRAVARITIGTMKIPIKTPLL